MLPAKRALVVPTLSNFEGLAALFASVDLDVLPIVIPNWRTNQGVAASWNEGLRRAAAARCDVTYVVNDDVTFEPGCLEALAKAILTRGELVLVSGYETPSEDNLERKLKPRATYACFAVGREFLDVTGGFDEQFFPAYFEDNDMKRRLTLLAEDRGHQVDMRVTGAHYRHVGSATQNRDPDHPVVSPEQYMENKRRFLLKWGGLPEHERHRTPYGE
jgi:GT2 family glycosyltransferase